MKLDINEVYHKYITKIVIFSLFAHKRMLRQPNAYRLAVIAFASKRLPWKIGLRVETLQEWMSKEESRDKALDEILYGIESDEMYSVIVSFTTPLKETFMEINLKEEEKYQKYLYS